MHTLLEKIDRGQIWSFSGGIHPPEQKTLSNSTPISALPLPPKLVVPVRQHIGAPSTPIVKIGDQVLKGQALTKAEGAMSVPVHAPSSGVVSEIRASAILHPSGLTELCIVIDTDGKDQWCERHPVTSTGIIDDVLIRNRIAAAGISGMGGATFPTSVKLATTKPIEYLIINGAECEPYITSDDRLMREHAEQIVIGIGILKQLVQPKRIIIAIEDNKPEAVKAMGHALKQQSVADTLLRVIPTKYPSGSEKQLIEVVTGKQVQRGKLPADLGILMHNVGTCFAIKRAVIDDEPLIERVVTITGEQAQQAGNYWVPLGAPIDWLLQQTRTNALPQQPLIIGGPMMGFALHDSAAGVTKGMNCLIAPSLRELPPTPTPRNCIRCGECAQACPQQLLPQQLYWHAQANEHDKAQQLNLFDCIECGACAFVCPSDIPLVQHYRVAKAAIRTEQAATEKAAAAKIRFEARQARLEKEKQERENRHKRAAKQKADAAPSAAVAAAVAKLKAEQAAKTDKPVAQGGNDTDMAALRRQRKEQARAAKALRAAEDAATDSAAAVAKPEDAKPQPTKPQSAKPKSAAVAAAIAKAKAKQAAESANADAEPAADKPQLAKPKSAAVAAAIAKAKAKQAAESANADAESAADKPQSAKPKSAAVAAAIAKAKAKQAAERAAKAESPSGSAEASSEVNQAQPAAAAAKPKSAAVAAAIAKAKAKQAAERAAKAESPSDSAKASSEVGTEVNQAKSAAAAAKPKSAAVAAAIAKAKAKQAAEQAKKENK